MKKTVLPLVMFFSFYLTACGQATLSKNHHVTTLAKMDTSKLSHPTVKAAFDAWQKGDSKTFISFFVPGAALYDDGSQRDFSSFVKTACGHERFTSIDKVENSGLDIYGHFHTESWGDFKTYFKFHIGSDGKISRLDIGQAKY